jgi:hypothetical protein
LEDSVESTPWTSWNTYESLLYSIDAAMRTANFVPDEGFSSTTAVDASRPRDDASLASSQVMESRVDN